MASSNEVPASITTTETENQVEGGFLLDVVVTKGAAIFKLLSSEDETLLVWRNAFLVLNLGLHVVNGVAWLNLEGDGLASQGLHEDLHTTTETKNQVEGRLLLDVVVTKGAAILKLFSGEDETLLIWRDAFLVLNLGLHVVNGVARLNFKSNGLASQSLHKDLHTTTETENQVEGRLLLDVVVTKGAAILKLFSGEDETLLVWRDAFLVLNLGLHVVNSVTRLNFKGDGLASQGLHEDLHTTSETENQVESRLLLDVVVTKGAAILKLLSGEDETLLIWRDAFLVLNLGLHVVNSVARLNFKSDGLASQGLHEDLHTTTETENQVESRLLLDVVVTKGAAILELFSGEDETLLVWGDAFLVLNLGLHVVNGVAWLNLEGDGLASQGLHEDLHRSLNSNRRVKSRISCWILEKAEVYGGTPLFIAAER